jgi:hypothetical protein
MSGLDYFAIGTETMLMFLICFGNGLLLLIMGKAKRLRNITNYFTVNLAIADFSLGPVMPFHIAILIRKELMLTNEYV